jgi:hypothetical protein
VAAARGWRTRCRCADHAATVGRHAGLAAIGMPSYGAAGNPVDVTAQGSTTGSAVMETLAQSDEIDMLGLITSLTSERRVSLDADRMRATTARCGKPIRVTLQEKTAAQDP